MTVYLGLRNIPRECGWSFDCVIVLKARPFSDPRIGDLNQFSTRQVLKS